MLLIFFWHFRVPEKCFPGCLKEFHQFQNFYSARKFSGRLYRLIFFSFLLKNLRTQQILMLGKIQEKFVRASPGKIPGNFGNFTLSRKSLRLKVFQLLPRKFGDSGNILMLENFGHLGNFYAADSFGAPYKG